MEMDSIEDIEQSLQLALRCLKKLRRLKFCLRRFMTLTIFSDTKIITFHFRTVEIDKIKLLAEKSVKFIFNLAAILPLNIVRELAIDCTALTRDHRTISSQLPTVWRREMSEDPYL